jgi:hypothetical protein
VSSCEGKFLSSKTSHPILIATFHWRKGAKNTMNRRWDLYHPNLGFGVAPLH